MNDDVMPAGLPFSPAWKHFFIVMGAVLLVALAVLFWVIAFRKRRAHSGIRYRRYHHHRHRGGQSSAGERGNFQKTTAGIKDIIEQEQQRQHRRHQHRSMNPTLAQTGGLPPVREESKPPTPTP
jgi:hypothetical protein